MDYAELQALIASYLDRELADWESEIQSFIRTVEAECNRDLRVGDMSILASIAGVADQEYYDLPVDYHRARSISVDGLPLEYKTPGDLQRFIYSGASGPARYYTIEAQKLRIYPTILDTTAIDLTYYQQIPALSATVTTNWLLDEHFDLYYNGALREAELFFKNDQRAAVWDARYRPILDSIRVTDKKDRWTNTPTKIRVVR